MGGEISPVCGQELDDSIENFSLNARCADIRDSLLRPKTGLRNIKACQVKIVELFACFFKQFVL